MAASLWVSVLSWCHSIWVRIFKQSQSAELPTSSPGCSQVDSAKTQVEHNTKWRLEKERFLRHPSLRSKSKSNGIDDKGKWRRPHQATKPLPPQICIQDWSSPGLEMDKINRASNTSKPSVENAMQAKTVDTLPFPQVALPVHTPELASLQTDEPAPTPVVLSKAQGRMPEARKKRPARIRGGPMKPKVQFILPAREPLFAFEPLSIMRFEPLDYPANARSALFAGILSDIPSGPLAQSVSMPMYTSSPKRKSPQPQSTHGKKTSRISQVPYPDVFDLDCYLARRTSRQTDLTLGANTVLTPSLSDNLVKAEAGVPLSRPIHLHHEVKRTKDQFRPSGYSRQPRAGLVTGAPVRGNPLSTLNANVDTVKPVLALPPVGFIKKSKKTNEGPKSNTAPICGVAAKKDCNGNATLEDSDGGSMKGLTSRLRDTRENLSASLWTPEEFLKMISSSSF